MKALVYRARQDLRYESISEPSPRAGQVLVKVKYAGVCNTDFNEYANGPIFVSGTPHARTGRSVPLVLGHEFSGQIVQTGSDVTERFPATIAMLAEGRLRADALITNCIPLSAGCEYIRDFETRGAANLKTFLEVDSRP
jgi:threonine dehydrogenase-like Zn-dependent dehydrogenase